MAVTIQYTNDGQFDAKMRNLTDKQSMSDVDRWWQKQLLPNGTFALPIKASSKSKANSCKQSDIPLMVDAEFVDNFGTIQLKTQIHDFLKSRLVGITVSVGEKGDNQALVTLVSITKIPRVDGEIDAIYAFAQLMLEGSKSLPAPDKLLKWQPVQSWMEVHAANKLMKLLPPKPAHACEVIDMWREGAVEQLANIQRSSLAAHKRINDAMLSDPLLKKTTDRVNAGKSVVRTSDFEGLAHNFAMKMCGDEEPGPEVVRPILTFFQSPTLSGETFKLLKDDGNGRSMVSMMSVAKELRQDGRYDLNYGFSALHLESKDARGVSSLMASPDLTKYLQYSAAEAMKAKLEGNGGKMAVGNFAADPAVEEESTDPQVEEESGFNKVWSTFRSHINF